MKHIHAMPARRFQRPHAGFTLIEIMLVVGIIVILMGAVLSRVGGFKDTAKIAATKGKISTVVGALGGYQTNSGGVLPSNDQGLRALVERPGGRPEPKMWVKILKAEDLKDAWGQELNYVTPARSGDEEFEVYSAGPNKKPNDSDDISSVQGE